MYNKINTWIAQSISWQAYIDFRLPKEAIARYDFIEDYDDFYLSLLSNAYDILEQQNIGETDKKSLLQIAKGLEIYSLEGKQDSFSGVDIHKNILFSASFYYLADFSASAYLLSKSFGIDNYDDPINVFISCFLRREFSDNIYCNLLKEFVNTGNEIYLIELYKEIQKGLTISIHSRSLSYLSFLLAERIVDKFKSNNIWTDLLKFNSVDYWVDFVKVKTQKSIPIWDFFPSQREAIFKDIFNLSKTKTIQMPTSAGKTAICELIIYDEFKKNNSCKILYLAPFRALAAELKYSLGTSLRKHGIQVKSIYGGNIPTQEEKIAIESANLLISTPEKFIAIEDVFPDLIKDFTTIICDEGHLIDDSNRGMSYELLLTRLKNDKRFVFISAIIPNIEIINSWLGGTSESIIKSTYRPTNLDFAFLKRRRNGYYLDVNPTKPKPENYLLNRFIDNDTDNKDRDEYRYINERTGRLKKFPINAKTTSVTCALKSLPSGTVALFAASKGERTGVRGLVNELINQIDCKLNLPNPINFSDRNQQIKLLEYFSLVFGNNYLLTKAVSYGILFHYGDLPQLIRELIEESLRKSYFRLVVCTNTLAEGVNLPIKTIVLYSVTRSVKNPVTNRWEPDKISIRDLKNLVGRAGRAGQETKGFIIATDEDEFDYLKKLIDDIEIEEVNGFLYNLIEALERFISGSKNNLSNELFEKLGENFLQLIDLIDKSIIHLIDFNTETNQIQEKLNQLIENTLTYKQSNAQQKDVVKKVFELRSNKIIPFIEQNKFVFLKQTGLGIREFENIDLITDFDNEIFETLVNPVNKEWLDFILDNIVFKIPNIAFSIEEFELNKTDLRNAIVYWINGYWFEDISNQLKKDVNSTLIIINNLICYHIQNIVASIAKIAETIMIDNERLISKEILNWSQYLLYGVNSQMKLDLIELGLNDRVAINALAEYIDLYKFSYNDYKELKSFILANEKDLRDEMNGKIPAISYDFVTNFIDRMKI